MTANTSSPTRPSSYRPDIDGLRAIAVLSVVLYHAGVPGISGGFAGVDVFFVISGFLITTLILQQQANSTFSLRHFYARRARRLFPALWAVLLVSLVLSWRLLMPAEMEDFGESLATAAAFGSNVLFWSEAGYFDGPSEFKPLLHTWSLAIEEQYYLLFPLVLLACRRWGHYLLALSALTLLSLGLSEYFVSKAPAAAFFLLPHRLWELMIGSLLGYVNLMHPAWLAVLTPRARHALSMLGVMAILFTVICFNSSTPFPGVNALLPVLGAAAVIASGPNAIANKLLALKPFVAVGLISYSLYLWHWPTLVFAKLYLINPLSTAQTLLLVALSGLIAWLSWRFIEQPFRTPRASSTPDRRVLRTSALCIVTFIVIGVGLDISEGAPGRLPNSIVAIAEVAKDKPPERKRCTGIDPALVSAERLCSLGSGAQPPDFILWGDSHAMTLAPRFAEVATSQGRTGLNATANGCAALLNAYRPEADPDGECLDFNAAVLDLIANTPSIKTVVLAGRWAIYAQATTYKHESGQAPPLVEVEVGADQLNSDREHSYVIWERSLRRTLSALEDMHKNTVIITSIPEVGWDTPNVIARSVHLDRPVSIAPTVAEFLQRQRRVQPVFSTFKQRILHPHKLLCDPSACQISIGNHPLYVDEDHLSSAGSRLLLPLVKEALTEPR